MMAMEEIGAVGAVGGIGAIDTNGLLGPAAVAPAGNSFGQWFTQEVDRVNQSVATARNDIQQLVAGETRSLHEVMIHMEEAKLSFQLLAQVRTKLLEAYQEVMRTQV